MREDISILIANVHIPHDARRERKRKKKKEKVHIQKAV
jgi:hypothetical protein